MRARERYDELVRRVREGAVLASCAELLAWDEDTYMPPRGAEHRGNQMALLAGLVHARATDPRVGELLTELADSPLAADPPSPEAVNVRELRRRYDRLTRLPRRLVEELARVTTLAQHAWAEARRDADFGRFRPWLEQVIALKREEALALAAGDAPYDALLDEYEPGMTGRAVRDLFDALRDAMVPLANALVYAPRRPDVGILHRHYPVERQRQFGREVVAALGFRLERGRIDTAAHPFFSSIGPGDCRLTTRYDPHDFGQGLFSLLHEIGHGLYEQGLDPEHYGTPMGEAVSLGMHEAQSRLCENLVGRSRAFWRYFYPLARQAFPEALGDVPAEDFYFAVHDVAPSLYRVGADEVTYNLHVLVRFELEQALLEGDLKAADLPGAWAEAYRHTLGVAPRDDAEGCLQDSHWSAGQFGYFPTYTLGNVYGAQLFAAARRELGDLDGQLSRGDFTGLLGWLREKVYRHGHRYPAARLIEHATGAPPNHRPLVQMLRHKYGDLYGL